jgi:Na+-driven multidrug efflux pump
MDAINTNNKLIRKTILSMFGGSLAAMVTSAIALMADTILAGAAFGKTAIAAVAIGTPIINIFQALTQTIINGASIRMNVSAGKGETKDVQSSFALGVLFSALMGVLFIIACQLFAGKLVIAFGGTEDFADMAELYLRGATGCIVFGTLNLFMSKTLALFGLQKIIFRSSFLAVFLNVIFSLILINVLPDNMAIMGLGCGTWMSGCVAALSSYFTLRKHNISLKLKIKDIKLSVVAKFFGHGIPSSGNNLADGVVSGIVNNIIVSGSANGVVMLSVFTAVKSIVTFATAIIQAINLSAAPLFGIMYGSRDKTGILRSLRESIRLAITALLICAVLVMATSVFWAKVYDMQGINAFYIGLAICMFIYLPLTAVVRITTQFFESLEKPLMGFMYSAIPDSVIFPVLLALLLPVLGYNGIWISYSLNAIPFIFGLYLLRSIKSKSAKLSYDRMLCIDEEIRDNVSKIDISINSDNQDVTFISEKVYTFLKGEGVEDKTAHTTALCLEEISADFVEHTDKTKTKKNGDIIMDIKLFSDKDMLRMIIRNEAPEYNPLDFVPAECEGTEKMGVRLAKKLAKNIHYSYVYKMNSVTIDINK